LRPLQLLGEHVVAFSAFERKAESVRVEGTGCFGVSYDRGDARYELDIHRLPPPSTVCSQLEIPDPARAPGRVSVTAQGEAESKRTPAGAGVRCAQSSTLALSLARARAREKRDDRFTTRSTSTQSPAHAQR